MSDISYTAMVADVLAEDEGELVGDDFESLDAAKQAVLERLEQRSEDFEGWVEVFAGASQPEVVAIHAFFEDEWHHMAPVSYHPGAHRK